ncbi:hypothetical protein DH2020_030735 [Rehmannia glutinosa]|uniref:ARM repeat superfamily protein n=1 Tax=Rehmannia glutinosa TaxID=99300 RepID=A0ABR0VMW4_REHGL
MLKLLSQPESSSQPSTSRGKRGELNLRPRDMCKSKVQADENKISPMQYITAMGETSYKTTPEPAKKDRLTNNSSLFNLTLREDDLQVIRLVALRTNPAVFRSKETPPEYWPVRAHPAIYLDNSDEEPKMLSSGIVRYERSIEEEAERKIGWVLKTLFFGTATVVGYNLFPYMGENLMQQSVSLLHVKDPLFKRMGASRLARFAIDDKRRMKIVELGGAQELVCMLASAKDDRTRNAALKALVAISKSDDAVGALHEAGAIPVIRSVPDSAEDNEIEKYKLNLLSRFRDLRYDISS